MKNITNWIEKNQGLILFFFLILMIIVFGATILRNNNQNREIVTRASSIPCKCYCSDLCGPRDRKAIDRPFVDRETGICFCADRDKRNFVSNGCNRKPVQSFANSCCG